MKKALLPLAVLVLALVALVAAGRAGRSAASAVAPPQRAAPVASATVAQAGPLPIAKIAEPVAETNRAGATTAEPPQAPFPVQLPPPPLTVGMTEEEVTAALGRPRDKGSATEGIDLIAVWGYPDRKDLWFRNGKLESWNPRPLQVIVWPKTEVAAPVTPPDPSDREAVALVERMQRRGITIYKVELGRVWIDPGAWAALNRDQKERVLTEFARLGFLDVLSYSDDRKLGSWGVFGASIKE